MSLKYHFTCQDTPVFDHLLYEEILPDVQASLVQLDTLSLHLITWHLRKRYRHPPHYSLLSDVDSNEISHQPPPEKTTPVPSVTPHMSCFLVYSPALLLFSEHTQATQYPFCSKSSETEHNIQSMISPLLLTRGNHFPHPTTLFWCWPWYWWSFWTPGHAAGLCSAGFWPAPSGSFMQIFSHISSSLYLCVMFLWPKCMIQHLALLNVIWLDLVCWSSLSRFLLKAFLNSSRGVDNT